MDKEYLLAKLDELDNDINMLVSKMNFLKSMTESLLEENAELSIKNDHLIQQLNVSGDNSNEDNNKLSKSRLNLEKIYKDGYHICTEWFGKPRSAGEECAFCLSVIYGKR